jgi:hypothetical protein
VEIFADSYRLNAPVRRRFSREPSVCGPRSSAGRVLPVAAAIPLLIMGLMVFNKTRQRYKKGGSMTKANANTKIMAGELFNRSEYAVE